MSAAQVSTLLSEAIDAGLIAAGETYRTAIKRALAPGYTTGAFVTGALLGSIEATPPADEPAGRTVHVGTRLEYAVYWEFGHQNLFTGKFEREERWLPVLAATAAEQERAFVQAAEAVIAGAGAGGIAAPVIATHLPALEGFAP